MSVQLTEEQNKLVDIVAKNNGFTNYQIAAVPGTIKGDNFLGILTAITIQDGRRKLELILKSAHQSEAFRKAAPLHEAYKREIYLYEVIFNEFRRFEEANGIEDVFDSYPKMYAASLEEGHECFIMENLRFAKYQLWDKKNPMNSEHLSAVLKEYAKFHAISFAMKKKNRELFDQLTNVISRNIFDGSEVSQHPDKMDAFIKGILQSGYEAVKDNPELTQCLQNVEPKMRDMLTDVIKDPKFKFVVTHGDNWCNNFLFKYQDQNNNKTLSKLKIVDWQLSYIGSPASDFCYFYLVHGDKQTFADYKKYVQLYYDTLANQIRQFQCDPEELFSQSEFEEHIKTFMIFGFQMTLMLLKIMVCESNEAPDLAEVTENGNIEDAMSFDFKAMDSYKERLVPVVEFLKSNKFI